LGTKHTWSWINVLFLTSFKVMKTIYIVEDNPDILEASKIILEQEGYEVSACLNSFELMDALNHKIPDLILLDFRLSRGKTEEAFVHYLASQKKLDNVPLLVFSADHKVKERAMEAGADGFLAKPFDIDDLLKEVEDLMPQ
jgi:DNA-binding response OmpR family regulator